LDHFISLPPDFFTPDLGFCILGAPVGSTPFVESFVAEALHEDFRTITSLPMFTDIQTTFAMLFVVLCLVPMLVVSYNVSIFRYFAILCWKQYLYHNYVGEITWCGIFWWFYQSSNLSSCHYSYFFGRVWPPLCGSDYYPHVF